MDVKRAGYSLLELVAVLAVLLILVALAFPSLRSMQGPYQLNGAVDSVRAAWAQARGRAIAEGRPYRFAIVPDSGHYRVAPDGPEFWGGGGGDSGGDGKALVLEESLPRGVLFASGGGAAPPPEGGSAQADDRQGSAPSPDAYTTPIVFLPDGTAREDAELVFQVRGAASKVLCLRGLTGVVTVKPGPSP